MKILLAFTFYLTIHVTSYSNALNGIENPKVKWKFKTQGTIRSAPVIADNNLYFGSADGFMYALNKDTGSVLWKFKTDGAIAGSPVVSEQMLIFSSRDNHVYAVNSKGELAWKFQMEAILAAYTEWEYFTAAPVLSGTNVLVGSGDGHLYALDKQNGTLVWKFKTGGRIRATPLVADGIVYQPSNDGIVYVLNAAKGTLQWNFKTEGASLDKRFGFDRTCIFSKPAIKNNLLVFSARDGNTYAVDIKTHQQKWKFTYGPTWAMSTAIDNETVFVGWSTNNRFCAIDLNTGNEKWKFEAGSVVYTTGAVQDDQVIFGSADGNLYCLDKKTGKKYWQYTVGKEIHSSPVYASGTIYFGCDNGYLYALENGMKPHKAVYQPISKNGPTGYPVIDPKIAPYLKDQGYKQLDSAQLYQFIKERISDQAPSVIVFAYDVIPPNIMGDNPKEGMIRKYLEGGGKIIWFGWIPNLFAFDSKGKGSGQRDVSIATRMLEVDFISPEESGNYYSRSTQEGLNIGLPTWFKTTYAVVSPETVIPLAVDEYGRVGAWIKKFNLRSGSGFISCRTWAWDVPIQDEDLQLIDRLAMHELE